MWVGSASSVFSERRFQSRVRGISTMFAIFFVLLIVRLFFLQIVRGDDFAQISESNRTQVIFLRAPRGDIYDREGKTLITNRPGWSLLYSPPSEGTLNRKIVESRLEEFLKNSRTRWKRNLMRAFQTKKLVRLVEDVPNEVAFGMRELGDLLPGASMQMEFQRFYPDGALVSHLVGHLGEVNENELKNKIWEDRRPGDLIGKMGLERIFDESFRGKDGGMLIEIDSIGRLQRVIKELPSKKGSSLYLTVDAKSQEVAMKELAKTSTGRGAVVAMDVYTGEILTWFSAPPFSVDTLAQDLNDPQEPLFDRVYRGAYPPGSLFKVITAIAGFKKNMIRTSETIECVGHIIIPDRILTERKYRCWKKHGVVNFWKAIAQSCDSYFYLLSQKVGSQAIYETAEQFGILEDIQHLLPGELETVVPNPSWKRKQGKGGWSTGDTLNMSIGQGYITSSPLHMAYLFGVLATKGQRVEPYFVKKIVDANDKVVETNQRKFVGAVNLPSSIWDAINEALRLVVKGGSGAAAYIPYLDVRGKTGTAQNPHGEDHAWFAAYAGYPGEDPHVAICVFVENGGGGGAIAAPIARRILEVLLPPRLMAQEPS